MRERKDVVVLKFASSDLTLSLKFLVRVSDSGTPPLSDEAVVTITINRNLWAPAFNPLNYATTVQETLPAGSNTDVVVIATDQDLNVSFFLNVPLFL